MARRRAPCAEPGENGWAPIDAGAPAAGEPHSREHVALGAAIREVRARTLREQFGDVVVSLVRFEAGEPAHLVGLAHRRGYGRPARRR